MKASVSRRMLTLRYPATCSLCTAELVRGTKAWWDREAKQATCVVCGSGPELAYGLVGTAGGSGREKYDRLRARREAEVKGVLGDKLGGIYLFFKDEPQRIKAWRTGSEGERRLARFFDVELPESAIVLHDRGIPGSRANIDHIVVAPSGVWVIDAKLYSGKVECRTIGSFWSAQNRVFVGGRDRTRLVLGMERQVDATRGALAADQLAPDVPVRAAVCFVASEWGLFARPFELHGVAVTWPKRLAQRIAAPGPLTAAAVARLANRIAVELPPALRHARDAWSLHVTDHPPDRRVLAAFVTAVVLGGVNFVGVRYSNEELDPIWGAALRFGAAAVIFGLLCAALRLTLPRGRALGLVVAYGLIGFGGAYGALYWAMQEAPAGLAAVVLAIGPLLVLLLAVAHRLERFSVRAAVGAVIALAGTGLMFFDPGDADVGWASMALLGVAALAASESVVVSKLVGRQHPMAMNVVGMTAGTLALLSVALLGGDELALPHERDTQLAVAYLVVATVGMFLCILYVVQRWTASATAYTFVSMPVVAVLAGAALLDEPITAAVVAGGAVVVAGVYVGAISRSSSVPADAGAGELV